MFIALDTQHVKHMRCVVLLAVISPLQNSSIFSHKRHYFRRNVIEHKMCVLIFSTNVSETYLILRRIERVMIKMYIVYCSIETRFCCHIFEKYSNIKFDVNLSSGSRVAQCGESDLRTDRHNEANSRFLQFCERA